MATERPILFSGPMIRAILNSTKTQTRRIVKPQTLTELQPGGTHFGFLNMGDGTVQERVTIGDFSGAPHLGERRLCPYGKPGDGLWVRETHLFRASGRVVDYRVDMDPVEAAGFGAMYGGWKPSIHMPRWASRINLEVTGVRVERLNDISEEDARAEGVELLSADGTGSYIDGYRILWESINGKESWQRNEWVWVISFKPNSP